ncbi:MAG: hypothetical protein ACOYI5_08080 [Christensenellales bacterium]|jgi:hypothetical protein
MAVFTKIIDRLRGARRVEYIALLVLLALALFVWTQDRGADTGVSTALEMRMERALGAVDGAGSVRVMITQAEDGGIVGVLIVADGADDLSVRLALREAAHTLLGVDNAKIEIARMRGD